MLNTSVMDINSTSVYFKYNVCFDGVYVGMTVAYVAVSLWIILGTPAQCWLLWLYLRAGWKVKPSQVFPLNLIILGLISCIQCVAEIVYALNSKRDTLEKVIFIIFGLHCAGRCLMQICICVERYLAVIHPTIFLKYKALQYRIVCAAVVWLMASGYGVYEAFADYFPDPIFNSIFIISVIVISFCCVSVLRALKHPGPGDTQITIARGREVGNQQKRKAFNTIFTGLLIILFTYLPQISIGLIYFIKIDEKLFICDIVPILNTFNILGAMIIPLMTMYRNGFMKCFTHQRQIKKNHE